MVGLSKFLKHIQHISEENNNGRFCFFKVHYCQYLKYRFFFAKMSREILFLSREILKIVSRDSPKDLEKQEKFSFLEFNYKIKKSWTKLLVFLCNRSTKFWWLLKPFELSGKFLFFQQHAQDEIYLESMKNHFFIRFNNWCLYWWVHEIMFDPHYWMWK